MFGSEFIEQSIFSASKKGTAIIPFITAGYPEKTNSPTWFCRCPKPLMLLR